jgi:hypothetical protein
MEVIELWRHLKEANYECVSEAEWLMILVSDDSKVIVDLSMPPTPRTPPPRGVCVWPTMFWRNQTPSWNDSGRPMPPAIVRGTRCHPFLVTASFSHPTPVFLPSFICEYIKKLGF